MTASNTAEQTGAPPRLVLVGRTGLDEQLRDAEFQLVRARSGLDAIGVLAGAGAQAVILGEQTGAHGPAEARQMIEAMRRVRPGVRIIAAPAMRPTIVATAHPGFPAQAAIAQSAADIGPVDATVGLGDSVEAIRRVIRGEAAAPHAPHAPPPRTSPSPDRSQWPQPRSAAAQPARQPALRPEKDDGPTPSARASLPTAATDPALADAALARTMARGSDILGPAIDLLRQRSGDPGLRFVARATATEPAGRAEGALVRSAGEPVGHLLSDRLPEGKLAAAAEWLGAWLTLRDQHAQLRDAAFTDALTGAWNRRYFDRFLDTALREARRSRHEVTLLIFDIDDFKQYNDAYGHGAGDEILVETARLMRSVVRPSDRVCRIGGDEFAVIFNEPQGPREAGSQRPTSIMHIAERFQQQVALARFPKLGECAHGPLTVSGGLASFPWDGHDGATLLRIADERALASKRQGKNAITFGQEATDGRRPGCC